MLASNGWVGRRGMLCLSDCASVLELSLLSCEAFLDMVIVAVLQVAGLNTSHLMGVLLWENLSVLYGLDRGVVMVLVNFPVHFLDIRL